MTVEEILNELLNLAKGARSKELVSRLAAVRNALSGDDGRVAIRAVKAAYQTALKTPLGDDSRVTKMMNFLLQSAMKIEGHEMSRRKMASRVRRIQRKLALLARAQKAVADADFLIRRRASFG